MSSSNVKSASTNTFTPLCLGCLKVSAHLSHQGIQLTWETNITFSPKWIEHTQQMLELKTQPTPIQLLSVWCQSAELEATPNPGLVEAVFNKTTKKWEKPATPSPVCAWKTCVVENECIRWLVPRAWFKQAERLQWITVTALTTDPSYHASQTRVVDLQDVSLTQTPRDELQHSAIHAMQEEFLISTDKHTTQCCGSEGILSLYTGAGKTFLAIYAILKLWKMRALIVVDKVSLMQQWMEAFHKIAPTVKIGKLQGDINDAAQTDNFPIVVASIHSLRSRPYPFLDTFGVVVVDECHHIGACKLSQVMWIIQAPILLGLSATPERKDETTKLISTFLGPVFMKELRVNKNIHVVPIVVRFPETLEQMKIPKLRSAPTTKSQKVASNPKTNTARLITALSENQDRTNCILEIMHACWNMPGTKRMLVLVHRKSQAHTLAKLMSQSMESPCQVSALTGDLKSKAREVAIQANIIVSLYGLAGEGMDFPGVNVMVLASPVVGVEQIAGRIRIPPSHSPQYHETCTSTHPLIVDMIDPIDAFANYAQARFRFYRERGYRTHWNVITSHILQEGSQAVDTNQITPQPIISDSSWQSWLLSNHNLFVMRNVIFQREEEQTTKKRKQRSVSEDIYPISMHWRSSLMQHNPQQMELHHLTWEATSSSNLKSVTIEESIF